MPIYEYEHLNTPCERGWVFETRQSTVPNLSKTMAPAFWAATVHENDAPEPG
jgi:hypothetical protein